MSNSVISALLLIATLGCTLGSFLIRAWIIARINFKRDAHSQISYLDRDFSGMLDLHRQFYPDSTLRVVTILVLGLLVVFGLSFTFVQGLWR
jgi:membrane protein YqaA with SNARE-associated domain